MVRQENIKNNDMECDDHKQNDEPIKPKPHNNTIIATEHNFVKFTIHQARGQKQRPRSHPQSCLLFVFVCVCRHHIRLTTTHSLAMHNCAIVVRRTANTNDTTSSSRLVVRDARDSKHEAQLGGTAINNKNSSHTFIQLAIVACFSLCLKISMIAFANATVVFGLSAMRGLCSSSIYIFVPTPNSFAVRNYSPTRCRCAAWLQSCGFADGQRYSINPVDSIIE